MGVPTSHSGVFDKCRLILQKVSNAKSRHYASTRKIDVGDLPKYVVPQLQEPIVRMFEVGPHQWVETQNLVSGVQFQRGLGGVGAKRHAQESIDMLSGKASQGERHTWLPEKSTKKTSSDLADGFSLPIVVRGKLPKGSISERPGRTGHLDEGRIKAHTVLSDHVSGLSIVFPKIKDSGVNWFNSHQYANWSKSYLDLYNSLRKEGMVLDPDSRGAQFTKKIVEIDRMYGTPDVPYYLSSSDGSMHNFYESNKKYFHAIEEVLKEYE